MRTPYEPGDGGERLAWATARGDEGVTRLLWRFRSRPRLTGCIRSVVALFASPKGRQTGSRFPEAKRRIFAPMLCWLTES